MAGLAIDRDLLSVQAWQDQAGNWWRSISSYVQTESDTGPPMAQPAIIVESPRAQPEPASTSEPETAPILEALPSYEPDSEFEHSSQQYSEGQPTPELELKPEPEPEPEPEVDSESEVEPKLIAEEESGGRHQVDQTAPGSQTMESADVSVESATQSAELTGPSSLYIAFAFDSASLSEEAKASLDGLTRTFIDSGSTSIRVTGYADKDGSRDYNLALSRRRAEAVAQYLVAGGIDAGFLTVQGLGVYKDIDGTSPENAAVEGVHGRIVQLEIQITRDAP